MRLLVPKGIFVSTICNNLLFLLALLKSFRQLFPTERRNMQLKIGSKSIKWAELCSGQRQKC